MLLTHVKRSGNKYSGNESYVPKDAAAHAQHEKRPFQGRGSFSPRQSASRRVREKTSARRVAIALLQRILFARYANFPLVCLSAFDRRTWFGGLNLIVIPLKFADSLNFKRVRFPAFSRDFQPHSLSDLKTRCT